MPFVLRDYQLETILATDKAFEMGYKAPLNVLFTGAGKTEIFIEYIIRSMNFLTERVLVNSPAHLTYQMYQRFLLRYPELTDTITIDYTTDVPKIGIVLGEQSQDSARIVCASVPTLIDRDSDVEYVEIQRSDFVLNSFGGVDLAPDSERPYLVSARIDPILHYGLFTKILNDEAHHSVAPAILAVHRHLFRIDELLDRTRTKTIGFTATAYREDGVGLDNLYDCIAIQKPVNWGIANGYLAPLLLPVNVRAITGGTTINATKVDNWTDILVEAYQEKGEGRLALAYFNSVEDSIEATKAFNAAGIPTAHIDGTGCIDTDNLSYGLRQRGSIVDRFLRGEIRILANYGVFIEGKDLPPASCMIWARNTENSVIFTQALGRVLRLFDGNEFHPKKENALVINATDSPLVMLTMGSLLGIKVGMDDFVVENIEEDSELELDLPEVDVVDIRDTESVIGEGIEYTVGRIIKHSGSDWYHGDSDVLTLKLNLNDTLVIVPPHYTLAKRYEILRDSLYEVFASNSGDAQYQELLTNISNLELLFASYTLWHVQDKKIVSDSWVYEDHSLALVMDFSIPYAHTNSEAVVRTFVNRGRRGWKKQTEPMSRAQYLKLKELGEEPDLNMSKVDAFQRIGYVTSFIRVVRPEITKRYLKCEELIKAVVV